MQVTYFTVNQMTLVGTSFEWERGEPTAGGGEGGVDAGSLGEQTAWRPWLRGREGEWQRRALAPLPVFPPS